MGYKTKEEIIEALSLSHNFSSKEKDLLERLIMVNSEKEAIIDSYALNEIEKYQLRDRFLEFCEKEGIFFDWQNNAKKGID